MFLPLMVKFEKFMMRKILKVLVLVLALAFIALQFVRPDFTNPTVVEFETLAASTQVPPEVEQVLTRSCNDCHTHETSYPWYSRVSPFNWFLAGHIDDGRRHLNLSVWNTYSREKKTHKLEEICEMVESAAMPLPSYLWIHRDAVLKKGEAELLCNWAKIEAARIQSADLPGN